MSKQRSCIVLILVFVFLSLFNDFRLQAQLLPDDEVQTLQQISSRLNRGWNVTLDSCRTGKGFNNINYNNDYISNVACDCTFNNSTICHVTIIQLMTLGLNGELPVEFANLTYLRYIILTRNYFKGFIPRQWASLPRLVVLSLQGNLITGTIPKEIGNIRTLGLLNLQDNRMEGPIPKELGNLVNLNRVNLGGNDFTGELPDTFGNLKNLTEFKINGVSFSGKIPEFIGNWTKLEYLDMQGTSMEGPIPSTISLLTNLKNLYITDLRASNISFPDLRNLTNLERLVLRNCSITGPIPQYIGQNLIFEKLDLSFNRLNGTIPGNLARLKPQFMYLTGNSLTGQVSQWLSDTKENFDISYNNFTGSAQSTNCQANNLKKIASYSSLEDKSIDWCLKKDLPCPKKSSQYELFINCGGPMLSIQGKQYEPDTKKMGPSSFFSDERWACSTTGDFLGTESPSNEAVSTTGRLFDDIYSTARLAPVSLRYYGRCLIKGSYTVKLHFAEIMLTADHTNNTRGTRIFDIYIQGDRVLSDFNIAEEAGGIGKGIEKVYTTNVIGSTLEIHLYWSGKGTTDLPKSGIYGPLISAISVTPIQGFDPPTEISAGAIVGIVVALVVVVVLINLAALWKKGYVGGKYLEDKGDIPTGPKRQTNIKVLLESYKFLALQRYKYSEIMVMTKYFKHILGQGGYGRVFKGTLRNDGRLVAVKILNESKGSGEEFINEVVTIGRTNHVNVVSLLGFCIEGTKRALVYEFLPNGSLEKYIYNENTSSTHLGWEKLYQIALGIARGLEYLHCRCNTRILHFDIKPHNILLDQDFLPKISDFGLAKLCPSKESIVSMVGARGTMGYIAPELSCRNLGGVSHKSDVYSYGMMVLEMIGGRKNLDVTVENMSGIYFPHWIYNQLKREFEVEEPEEIKLDGAQEILRDETAKKMIIVALWCIQTHPANRPSMTKVVEMLEENNEQLQMPPNPSLDPLPLS